MNNPVMPSYLSIVKDELGARLLPALEAGQQQQVAMCGQYILTKLLTEARHRPTLLATARNELAQCLPGLRAVLTDGADQALLANLDAQLGNPGDAHPLEPALQTLSQRLQAHPDQARAAALNKQLVGIENRLHGDFTRLYLEEIARTSVPVAKEALSAEQRVALTQWLRQTFPGNDALEIQGIKQIPGGFSKHTIFLFLAHAQTLPDTVVVRLDWAGSAVGTTVTDEYQVIDTLFRAGVKVPQPFALEASGSVLGGPFLLVSKAEGANPGDAFDVRQGSPALALDVARTLATLHTVPVTSFGDRVPGAQESNRQSLLRDIAKFEADWRALGKPSASMETAYAWLKRHAEQADGPRALIHKDAGCHNMLAHQDQLSVLLDWETASIGSPAQDLGYVKPLMTQLCDWTDFMAAYVAAGGPAVTPQQVDYYVLWGYTWVNTMVMQAQAAFEAGLVNDVRAAFAGTYLASRCESRLREQLYAML